jgi:lipopolysaccharide export system protein LptA
MIRLTLLLALTLAPVLAAEAQARAPAGRCQLRVAPRGTNLLRTTTRTLPSGLSHLFFGGGVRATCPEQNLIILSDSVEYYEDTRLLYLIGNVDYSEPRLKLEANRVTYWQSEERLRAEGNVDATLPSGTTLEGPLVDYYRVAPGIRTSTRMVATQRPTIRIVERDTAGRSSEPVQVVANRVVQEADSLVYASGRVVLTRPDLVARGDSAFVDNGSEFARLMREPVVEGQGERPFTLTGRVIDVFAQERRLERAVSRGNARAVSDSTTISAVTLDFRLVDAALERAFAWGPSRARVVSPSYDVLADSLDVQMPNQRVERVYAVGDAFIESDPDSTRFRSAERDWLRGDTITAQFDTTELARRDTTRSDIAIEQLDARGNARSFYQLVPRDTTTGRPAINYVTGRAITVSFEDRQVENVAVMDQASGVYLEPGENADAPAAAARSTPSSPPRTRPASPPARPTPPGRP